MENMAGPDPQSFVTGRRFRSKTGWIALPNAAFQFLRRWPVIPVVILGILVFSAIFAEHVAPTDPYTQQLRSRHTPPVWQPEGNKVHLLGADHVGRDLLSRIIFGARISLVVVCVALTSGLLIGTTLGLVAGWYGGVVDEVISRIVDIWYALPFILVALVVVLIFGQSVIVMMGVLAMVSWVAFVRTVRAEVLSIKRRDYVLIATICGASTARILVKHVLPGALSTIVVIATLSVGSLILTEATLSFLGAGIPGPTPAWGLMVAEGTRYITVAWWTSFFPGLAIFLVVMSLNFVGDWMRDRFDPRLRQL